MSELKDFKSLKPGSHIHLMGVCGTAMASLAGLLKDSGYKVTGSDEQAYPPMSTQLEELGIGIMKGYKKENLEPRPDLVIVGNVIRKDMEETVALLASDIPYTSLPKAMGEFVIGQRQSIVISGTHGKTTSTSMAAHVLQELGYHPGFLVGGIPLNFKRSFQRGDDPYFVIEGDEYDTAFFDKVPKFIHYKPKHVIITSIEFDHADIYASINEIKASFSKLVGLIPADGTLVYVYGDENISDVLKHNTYPLKTFSYGLTSEADYTVTNKKREGLTVSFEVTFKGESLGLFELGLIADYNIMNALGVIAVMHSQGLDQAKVRAGLKTFLGVKRRQEVLGEVDRVLVIEDFAHHPTAVGNTITAVKAAYPKRKLISVFEPRSATSRRKIFQTAYTEAFKGSDVSVVAEPYDQSRIDEKDRFSTTELIADIEASGGKAMSFKTPEDITEHLLSTAQPGDIILIMSNGGFGGIYGKILGGLRSRQASFVDKT